MLSHCLRIACLLLVPWIFVQPASADLKDLMKAKGRKILFLGDSNTYAGQYIAYVEGYLRTRFPDEPWELINLGLPSETLSGLSEPDHPYPRPDVHERVERALSKIKPDIVFVCYGMNDGIYSPFSADRLKKYQQGTEKLVAKIEKTGAKVVLMTPAPFDGAPVAKNLLPRDAPKHSWMKPYENYDQEVLRAYSDYLLEWRKKDHVVVDAHAAVHRFLKTVRTKEPKYTVSGDGIHPNATGHALIAFEILRELKAPGEVDRIEIDFKSGKALHGAAGIRAVKQDSVEFNLHRVRSMWSDAGWDKRLNEVEQVWKRFNQGTTFKVIGLPKGNYEIAWVRTGKVFGSASSDAFARGIAFEKFDHEGEQDPQTGAKFYKGLHQRQQILRDAWLTEVGHKRPGVAKGLPLAQAQEKAKDLYEREVKVYLATGLDTVIIRKMP